MPPVTYDMREREHFSVFITDCWITSKTRITEFTEGHQYQRSDGLVGTGLMP